MNEQQQPKEEPLKAQPPVLFRKPIQIYGAIKSAFHYGINFLMPNAQQPSDQLPLQRFWELFPEIAGGGRYRGRQGQFARAVAKRRRLNEIAKESRRINRNRC